MAGLLDNPENEMDEWGTPIFSGNAHRMSPPKYRTKRKYIHVGTGYDVSKLWTLKLCFVLASWRHVWAVHMLT